MSLRRSFQERSPASTPRRVELSCSRSTFEMRKARRQLIGGDMGSPSYKRVLLKLSGEAFAEPGSGFGIEAGVVSSLAKQIAEVQALGVEMSVVVGGGNIFRGTQASAMG